MLYTYVDISCFSFENKAFLRAKFSDYSCHISKINWGGAVCVLLVVAVDEGIIFDLEINVLLSI